MDTRSFGRLAGELHYALLIHGKPLFSTNASRLRFGDLTQYAWPTHFQFPSPQGNHSRDLTNLLSFYAPMNEVYQWANNNNNKIIIIITMSMVEIATLPNRFCLTLRVIRIIYRHSFPVFMKWKEWECNLEKFTVASPPVGVRSRVIRVSMSVCPLAYLKNRTSKFHEIFCTGLRYLWPCLCPPLTTVR